MAAVEGGLGRKTGGRLALAALALVTLLPALGTSIANVALPTLAETFGASFQAVQWVVLAYLLATTALVVSVGRLGDLVGRRRLLLAGAVVFAAASAACGLAPTLEVLVAARAVQGVGAAVLLALGMALVGEIVPKERTGSAMGLLGTTSAVGTALGPSLGGLLISEVGWRAIFLVNVPVALAALMLASWQLPADRRGEGAERARFDTLGTVVLAATLAAYALAMTVGANRVGVVNGALLVAAVAGAGLFVWVERRVASPLVRLAVLRDPVLGAGVTTSMLVSTVLMATLVVGPFYLARGLGLGPALVGLAMSVGPAVVALTGVPAGRIVDRVGAERMVALGLLGIGVGALGLSVLPLGAGVWGYVGAIVVVTVGYALFQTANNTAVMRDVPSERRGAISGLLNLSRNLGLVTGASVMGAVFALGSGASAVAAADATGVAMGMRLTFAVAVALILVALAVVAASRGTLGTSAPRGQRRAPAASVAAR
ncbi:MAG: MFS transporter [Chloroflexota bacterium]